MLSMMSLQGHAGAPQGLPERRVVASTSSQPPVTTQPNNTSHTTKHNTTHDTTHNATNTTTNNTTNNTTINATPNTSSTATATATVAAPPRLARSTMVTQRRYSVTGQTPPDDAEALKSVPPTSCGLCEGVGETSIASIASIASIMGTVSNEGTPGPGRGRNKAHDGTVIRTSSKRSATQLPSPSSPTPYQPPKMARFRRANADATDADTDNDMDSDLESEATNDPATPESSLPLSVASLPDAPRLEELQLWVPGGGSDVAENNNDDDDDDDDCMDDFALSSSHSRNQSLDRRFLDPKHDLQTSWDAFQKAALVHAALATSPIEHVPPPSLDEPPHTPQTFLTLPPEIRHQIYRNCDNIVLHKPLVYCISTFQGEMLHPLASVSRLVRAEALAIFYSYNLWVIKVEFRIMYDAFQDWIIRLGPGASLLRLVTLSVRGSLLKPRRTRPMRLLRNGHFVHITPATTTPPFDNPAILYAPPDGDASFHIDLSEKFVGGRVRLLRNDGTAEAGDKATVWLAGRVARLWERRQAGTLNGQDWVSLVDGFLSFIGGW